MSPGFLPSTFAPRLAWLATALFVCYGTTLPFRFDPSLDHARLRALFVSANPLLRSAGGERVSLPDVAQNLLLFFPFGVAGALALTGRTPGRRIAIVSASALALSAAVETAQLFTWDRVASSSDVLFDTLGALAGASVTTLFVVPRSRQLQCLTQRVYRPALPPFAAAAALLCASVWAPFNFTFDVSTLAAKARAFFANPWDLPPYTNPGVEIVLAWLGGTAALVFFTEWRSRHERLAAWTAGALLCTVAEAGAAFVESTNPSVSLLALHVGAVTAAALQPAVRSRGRWYVFAALVTAAAVAGMRFDSAPALTAGSSAAGVFRGHLVWTIFRYAAAGLVLYRLAAQTKTHPALDLR